MSMSRYTTIGELIDGDQFFIGDALHTVYAVVIATGERCTQCGGKRHIWYDSNFIVCVWLP